jgi:hypothetical protein
MASFILLLPALLEDGKPLTNAAAQGTEPVAIISPIPDNISNGTRIKLNATDSYAPNGFITNYTWEVTLGTSKTYYYGVEETVRFTELGLYKVVLTVKDNRSETGTAFTAFNAVLDSDFDTLPDWWEVKYFWSPAQSGLQETAEGDFDGDGYTNLEEYARGTDPTHKDPQPGIVQILTDNWMYVAAFAGSVVVVLALTMPWMRRKRKEEESKKIEAAIEIEKALESDED